MQILNRLQTTTGNKTEGVKRLEYVDTLRVLACFLVILIHSNMGGDSSVGFWVGSVSFLGCSSSDLFFAVSGSVVLPVRCSSEQFYKRRFLKLIPPVIIWSVVTVFVYWMLDKYSMAQAVRKILFIPFYQAVSVYWFVYVIIGLYLFAPIISKWLNEASKKALELFLGLWSINLLLPYLSLLLDCRFNQSGSHYWYLNYFGGFLGFWILGYYLRVYPIKIGLNLRWLTVIAGTLGYCSFLASLKLKGQAVGVFMDNLQIGCALLVALIYTIAQNVQIDNKIQKIITDVSKCSFGIYLIHIIVVRELVWRWFAPEMCNPMLLSFIIAIISMALCYVVVKALSYLPKSKYIIGV